MLNVRDRAISTVGVVDDKHQARQSRGLLLSDSGLTMLDMPGPLESVEAARQHLARSCQALICDHHLNTNTNYAPFLGAELVAQAVAVGLPAILCTRYMAPEILDIRPYLPQIPVFISPQQLRDPDDLLRALEVCVDEILGEVLPERRVWRAQIVVEDVADDDTFIAAVPGWDTGQVIRLRRTDVPESLRDSICADFRTFVKANLGEERPERFFVTDWQTA